MSKGQDHGFLETQEALESASENENDVVGQDRPSAKALQETTGAATNQGHSESEGAFVRCGNESEDDIHPEDAQDQVDAGMKRVKSDLRQSKHFFPSDTEKEKEPDPDASNRTRKKSLIEAVKRTVSLRRKTKQAWPEPGVDPETLAKPEVNKETEYKAEPETKPRSDAVVPTVHKSTSVWLWLAAMPPNFLME